MPDLVYPLRLVCQLGRQLTTPLLGAVIMIRPHTPEKLHDAYLRGLLHGGRLFVDAAICRSVSGLQLAIRLNDGINFIPSLRQAIRIMFMHCWYKGLMTLVNYETAMTAMEPCVYGCTFDSWSDAINCLMWDFD